MNFKRYVEASDTWVDSHYIMGTSTDTITTLPADIYADGNNATVGISGNTVQTGTPTHESPIMPNGTGERTGNLWGVPIVQGAVSDSGDLLNLSTRVRGEYIPIQPDTEYTISCNKAIRTIYAYLNKSKVSAVYGSSLQTTTLTFTTPANCNSICVGFMNDPNTADIVPSDIEYVMLNTGSQPLPHEPYGYKIPISSANTTTPVYLGEVQTMRRVKKLVLTGEETSWTKASSAKVYYLWQYDDDAVNSANIISCMCSHYSAQGNVATVSGVENLKCCFRTTAQTLYIHDDAFESNADFVTYLQQQYAAGTPVTVWYVLETEQTAVVNEPLMKIGDYADEVSNVSIPVIAGGDTISVGTTLQPSEVSVNYKGWHPVADVHEYEETGQLYDKTTDVNGYRLNPSGNLIAESGYSTSLAIPVDTKFLTRNHEFSTMEPICEYKANNTFIARTVSGSTIELNDETSYVRMTVNNTWNDVMLKGSQWD